MRLEEVSGGLAGVSIDLLFPSPIPLSYSPDVILNILTSAESAVGYRLGRDYELMIKFNPDAFLPEKMMIQTVKEKTAVTLAGYVDMLKVFELGCNVDG